MVIYYLTMIGVPQIVYGDLKMLMLNMSDIFWILLPIPNSVG